MGGEVGRDIQRKNLGRTGDGAGQPGSSSLLLSRPGISQFLPLCLLSQGHWALYHWHLPITAIRGFAQGSIGLRWS